MKKLRKIVKCFQSVLILKRINWQNRTLNIQKRALNIRKGVLAHPTHPLRYATGLSFDKRMHEKSSFVTSQQK